MSLVNEARQWGWSMGLVNGAGQWGSSMGLVRESRIAILAAGWVGWRAGESRGFCARAGEMLHLMNHDGGSYENRYALDES